MAFTRLAIWLFLVWVAQGENKSRTVVINLIVNWIELNKWNLVVDDMTGYKLIWYLRLWKSVGKGEGRYA